MALENSLYDLIPRTEYIPDFYKDDPFREYQNPGRRKTATPSSTSTPMYDFSSDLLGRHRPEHSQTVEEIVNNGYFPIPQGDPVTAIISDKKHTSWMGLDDVIGQVRKRHELYQKNIYEIEIAKCDAINVFLIQEARYGFATGRTYYSLNKNLQDLYRQQRDERVTLWKDISLLRQTLPEAAQKYLTAYRKVSVLEDYKGDVK